MNEPGWLEAIEKRANAAIDGPWLLGESKYDARPVVFDSSGKPDIDGDPLLEFPVNAAVWECDDELDGCPEANRTLIATAEFVAHAREDIPALIARVKRLEEILESIEWMGPKQEGDITCPYCGARGFDVGDGPSRMHLDGCIVGDALK